MTGDAAFKVGRFPCRPYMLSGEPTGQWQVDIAPRFSQNGKRQRLLFPSRRQAHDAAIRLNRQLEVQSHFGGRAPTPAGMTLNEAVDLWTDEQVKLVQAGMKRAGSQETAAFQLKPVLGFMGACDLETITPQKVLDYQAHRKSEGRMPSTINSETAKLRQVMTWAVENKFCSGAPKVRTIPVRHRRIDLPSKDEMAKILAHMEPTVGLIARLFVETGCRKSEVFYLRWEDVDFDRNRVLIQPKEEGFTPKTAHSERPVYVDPHLIRLLKKARGKLRADHLVFPSPRSGGPRTRIIKALNAAAAAAGIMRNEKPIHLTHQLLRKAHATWQAMDGLPESVLQVRLGHVPGSRVTQQHYVHAAQSREPDGAIRLPTKRRKRVEQV